MQNRLFITARNRLTLGLAKFGNTRRTRLAFPFVAAFSLVSLSACTDSADTFPMNAAAQQAGPLKVQFVRTGVGNGPVTITLGDGEVLKGRYRVAFNESEGFAFSGPYSASSVVISGGPVQFVATGPTTQILCRGSSSTSGHGNGQCQTFDGAVWAVSW